MIATGEATCNHGAKLDFGVVSRSLEAWSCLLPGQSRGNHMQPCTSKSRTMPANGNPGNLSQFPKQQTSKTRNGTRSNPPISP